MKILVVDDSAVQRKMIMTIIQKAGFSNEILEAENGKAAIGVVGQNFKDICLILCDWNMPVMTGIEFVEGMSKVPAVAAIPVIMVTTEGTKERMDEAYSKHPNMAGYVVKPFSPDDLKEKISPFIK